MGVRSEVGNRDQGCGDVRSATRCHEDGEHEDVKIRDAGREM